MKTERFVELSTQGIEEVPIRENFHRLNQYLAKEMPLPGFRHYEFTFTDDVTNRKIPHNLEFQPKDLIQTYKSGTGTITWNYDKFDKRYLDVTTSGTSSSDPLIVRFLIGRI